MVFSQDGLRPPRLSDEELEYYGELYLACSIGKAGVDFESFLTNPEYYLRKYGQGRWRAGERDDGQRGLGRHLRRLLATRAPSD